MEQNKYVNWRKEGRIARVIIDHAPVNALSTPVQSEIIQCMKELESLDEINAVMITGAGEKAFVAGADLKEFGELLQDRTKVAAFAQLSQEMISSIDRFPKPTVAVLHGLALGGGCEIALACDIRVASPKMKIGLTEINVGVIPGGGGTQRLPRLLGEAKAKQMLYLGEIIGAEEALRIGLVNYLVTDSEIFSFAEDLCRRIAERPQANLRFIKQCVDLGLDMPLEAGIDLETSFFRHVFETEDCEEGITAFLEKRKPVYPNRAGQPRE